MATTRARYVSPERRLVNSSWLPTLGNVFISSKPPCAFTSRAWAFSTTVRPVASCHFACTGTMTGKRLPRRCSVLGGGGDVGVMSSSTRRVPQRQSLAPVSFWYSVKSRTRAPFITGSRLLVGGSAMRYKDIHRGASLPFPPEFLRSPSGRRDRVHAFRERNACGHKGGQHV